jgi:PhnB protein
MLGVEPYIAFNGNCEEAINFYKERLNGEILFLQRYGDSPMKGKAADDKVMHCLLKIGDSTIMASDNMSDEENPLTVGNNISLAIGTDDVPKAEKMFEKLSDGGTVAMPMQETFWAERFGMLTDKFGINWMFNCARPAEESERAAA